MTRKDYQLIANAIARTGIIPQANLQSSFGKGFVKGQAAQHRMTANSVANALADDDPNFDRQHFLDACFYDRNETETDE